MKPSAPTDDQIRDAYRLAKAAWAVAAPDDEFIPFGEWTAALGVEGLTAIVAFVRLARHGLN